MSLVVFDQKTFDELSAQARSSERLRAHRNLHGDLQDKCQRMLVGMEPGSYVQPHRHRQPAKPELLTVLRGSIAVLIFDDGGDVVE